MGLASNSVRIDLAREEPFRLGEVEFRPLSREMVLGDRCEVLEPRIAQVLTLLAKRRGEIVMRDELIAGCWESRAVGDDAISRCISRIRRLAESFGGFTLETIPRIGYRLNADSPAVIEPPTMEDGVLQVPAAKSYRKRLWLALAGIALVALLALGWFAIRAPEKLIIVSAPARQSIAVLPFSPLSSDPQAKAMGDAVAATVAEALSKVGEPVVSPTESMQYRGSDKARAGAALRAMYIVDGEVLKQGNTLRVTVRLDDAVRGGTIFAHTFEDDAAHATALTERIAAYIVGVSWGSDITGWDSRVAPEMLRAFEQQARGDLFAAYETARALAKAWPNDGNVQRAYAWDVINLVYASRFKRKLWLIEEANRAAQRASVLLPEEGEARAVLAATTPHFLWGERERHLRQALATSPDSVGLAEYLAWFLDDAGRFREAEPFARSAYERLPYHVPAFQRRAEQLLGNGGAEAALPVLAQARRLWPENKDFLNLTFEAAALGDHPEVIEEPEIVKRISPQTRALWQTLLRALQSRKNDDAEAAARACAVPGEDWAACLLTLPLLGKLDVAFRIADTMYPDQRAANREELMRVWLSNAELPSTRYLLVPATAPMRADPRFTTLAERIGLLAYWRTGGHPPDFCASERIAVCGP